MGVLYAACLSWIQLRELEQARTLLPLLRSGAADNAQASRLTRLLEAELALKSDDMNGVLKALGANLSSALNAAWPRPELLALSQASARLQVSGPQGQSAGVLAQTIVQMQRQVQAQPQDAQIWQALATALSAQDRPLASLRAEGESQLARLDFGAAVDRFRAAQDASRKLAPQLGDHIEAAIVDARLRHAHTLLLEQMRERMDRR